MMLLSYKNNYFIIRVPPGFCQFNWSVVHLNSNKLFESCHTRSIDLHNNACYSNEFQLRFHGVFTNRFS